MNWYKQSQEQVQQLLFNPWQDADISLDNLNDIKVERTTPEGERIYKCSLCGKEISEEELDHSTSTGIFDSYQIPVQPYDYAYLKNSIKRLLYVLKPYVEEAYSSVMPEVNDEEDVEEIDADQINSVLQHGKIVGGTYQANVPEAFLVVQDTDFGNICQTISNGSSKGLVAGSGQGTEFAKYVVMYLIFTNNTVLQGSDLESFSKWVMNPEHSSLLLGAEMAGSMEMISKSIRKVQQTVPVCDECYEKYPHCWACEDIILDAKKATRLGEEDGFICQKCLNLGYAAVCSECGMAYDSVTDAGPWGKLCESCAIQLSHDTDDWEQELKETWKLNTKPFNALFNPEDPQNGKNTRIYIPYTDRKKMSEKDKETMHAISSQKINMRGPNNTEISVECHITPDLYQEGYCYVGKRKTKISKVLNRLRKQYKEDIEKMNLGTDPKLKAQAHTDELFDDLLQNFESSEFRRIKDTEDLMVVISQDPVDIGFASTNRNWVSCMQFGCGGFFPEILREVKEGGLIAYLTHKEDKDVYDPIARVLIRRYKSDDGKSRLRTEGRVYGEAGQEFIDFVEEWIQGKQPPVRQKNPKTYRITGMDIVDKAPNEILAQRFLTNLMIKQAKISNPYLTKLIRVIKNALV